jgi:hypothetical protein
MTLERTKAISCRNTYTPSHIVCYTPSSEFFLPFFLAGCIFRISRLVFFASTVNLLVVADDTHHTCALLFF